MKVNHAVDRILILGASARAAAQSALRAGFDVHAADLFADADLRACADVQRVIEYPDGLQAAADAAPDSPWMYTGALENHPDLVERIASRRRLLGNSADVLIRVRDPRVVHGALRQAELASPAIRAGGDRVGTECDWLKKPLASGGGDSIARVIPDERQSRHPPLGRVGRGSGRRGRQNVGDGPQLALPARSSRPSHGEGAVERFYQQEFIEGVACSASFVAAGGRSILLGVTRQLVGMSFTHAGPFQYCGTLTPLGADARITERFAEIGQCLAAEFQLTGLFGVDAVIRGGEVWPVEVNPRYTASVEVLERAFGFHAIGFHVNARLKGALPDPPPTETDRFFGKAVLFAPRTFVAGPKFQKYATTMNRGREWPAIADIPTDGKRIETGQPIVSILAAAVHQREVLHRLRAIADGVYRSLAAV
jgi:predicted ATP-grasp superfamily ATP-dependent carboligase